jgi:Cu+-exporting ATPase
MSPRSVRTVLWIVGMRDCQCRDVVAEALESVQGVCEVDVNLFRARAVISHDAACTSADLVRAVGRAGYDAKLDEDHGDLGD